MKQRIKLVLGPLILVATVVAFWYYLAHHPETVRQIQAMPPLILILLVLLYGVWFGAYALMTRASLYMYHKHMSLQENFLFNAYSNLINFFGPGQSGPIFRGAYLKKRHNLPVKSYVFTLLIYFAFYGVISVGMAVVGTRPWWQTAILMLLAVGGSAFVVRWYRRKNAAKMAGNKPGLSLPNLSLIFACTLLQLLAQAVIFGVELHSIGAAPTIGQVLAYTGVANFALFVALTPGAIGIREAFLAFTQDLHHIDASAVVAGGVIDRAAYLVFLGILFILVISLHAKEKLQLQSLKR